ncbi:SRPBCC family protein [Leptospira sp. GIMC2001]|uniref:SRPBCC family protein n=1 Tax=Leptospira sp. GIMC2001 TaxID=1513297 RepID=UPI002348F62F|nr:SRPBCC family protein [Leptospira sp. GIMC2001]WCL48764.1 SRPBCC family protein [Leptospira sp. GIMC2001]
MRNNIIKILAISLVTILLLPFVVAIFTAKEYSVERSIIINKPKSEVFEFLKLLKNQDQFSVWASMDPGMTKEYKGEDGKVGFVSSWASENPDVGRGEQEILAIIPGERIDYELRFFEPFESKDKAYFKLETSEDNSTKVIWGFDGKMSYPANLMLMIMDFESILGEDFEQGLNNLKTVLKG